MHQCDRCKDFVGDGLLLDEQFLCNSCLKLERLLKTTEFVIEATDCEHQMLWEHFSNEALYKTKRNVFQWKQINPGCVKTIGEVNELPVCICLRWARIDGVLVMFYEATSRIVDHKMVEDWLEANSPQYDRNHCNAMNFHQALNYINEINK